MTKGEIVDKYLDLARELKKSCETLRQRWYQFGLEHLEQCLEKWLRELEIRGGLQTILTTELLKSAWISRSVLQTWADLLSLRLEDYQLKLAWKTHKESNSVDHRINLKECEKKDKYLDLAREQKKKKLKKTQQKQTNYGT